jgi:hypothetical protein
MPEPTVCTSMGCRPPQSYCPNCSHAIYEGAATINDREYRWQHSPQFGPLFWRRMTCKYDWTPHISHPIWRAYEAWLTTINNQEPNP